MRQSFTIPNWHPSRLNQLLNSHWAKAGRLKKQDRKMIAAYAKMNRLTGAIRVEGLGIKRRVELHLTLAPRQRAGDPDAYWKSTLDALVKCGLLVDDNRQWCEIVSPTFERGPAQATRITLTDI